MTYEGSEDYSREVVASTELEAEEAVSTILDGWEECNVSDQNWILSVLIGDNAVSRSLLTRMTKRAEMKFVKSNKPDKRDQHRSDEDSTENIYSLYTGLGNIHYQSSRDEIRLD